MSILTKVFIVVLAVASMVSTTAVVSITARTTNWKKSSDAYQGQLRIADTTIRNQNAAAAAQIATLRDSINAYDRQVNALRSDLQRSQGEVNSIRVDLKQAVGDRDSMAAMNSAG